MAVLLAATVVLFVSAVTGQDDASRPKKPYTHLLKFKDRDFKEAFESINLNKDEQITIEDLASRYFHENVAFAVKKFIQLFDTQKKPGSVDLEEFATFMDKSPLKLRVHGVTLLSTEEERKRFFLDEILTYVYLVIDQTAIKNLFASIESPDHKDGTLDLNEIIGMEMNLMNGNEQYKLSESEAKQVLREIGAGSESIYYEDFKEYLMDGNLSFLFRECRKKLDATDAEYDNACLVRKLVRYATRHVTEYLVTLVFDALDAKDKNQLVGIEDIQKVYEDTEDNLGHFLAYLNGGGSEKLSYGAFRENMFIPTFQHIFERECLSEDDSEIELEQRIECILNGLWYLAEARFSPKLVNVPDLERIILFEDLDTTNDGIIDLHEDLVKGRRWNIDLAKKFTKEITLDEEKDKVDLNDFYQYLNEPYMMTALGECQIIKAEKEKLDCYNKELEDMITNVLDRDEIGPFYRIYLVSNDQSDAIEVDTLKNLGMKEETIRNFLLELGHGNMHLKIFEFILFIKQQEPSHLFATQETVIPRKHYEPSKLHEKLLQYIRDYMTELDVNILFSKLDEDRDGVIEKVEIETLKGVESNDDLFSKIAVFGNSEQASYTEFWLFLNAKQPGNNDPRKRQLENGCARENINEKIECYTEKLKSVK